MSLLLNDPSLCTNDFSRILYSSPSDWNLHADVVDAHIVGSGLKQHIEYKITITAIPRNSLAFDAKTYSVYPRFRELNRLWNQLSKIHRQLYLHGTYPPFSPTRLFGNTEPAVVAERSEAIKRFLNFVFGSEVLRKATSLHHFFENVEEVETMNSNVEQVTTEIQSGTTVSTGDKAPSDTENDVLGSDCQIPNQIAESDTENVQSSVVNVDEAVHLFTVEASSIMNPSTSTSGVVTRRSSSCFLFDFPEADLESKLASDEDSLAASHICIRGSRSSESLVADSTERSSFVKSVLPRIANFTGRHVLRNSEVCDNSGTSHSSAHNSTNTYERTSIAGFPSQSITDQTSSNTLPVLFPFTESSAGNVIKNGNDYLNVAAQFISAAQKAESETAFELAFQCYKGAVKVLLQGVQLERDLSKRNRVRKKTAKYLLKAEKLYRSYLSFDGSAFEATSWLSTAIQDPSLLAFQSSNSLLKTYRVIDILPFFTARNRVFVVENTLHHEEPKYVMKLLQKSGAEKSCFGLSNKSIIPVEVPHMRDYFVKRQRQIEEASLLMEINLGSSVCSKELSEPCSSSMICTPVNKNTTSFGAEQKKGAYKGRHICFSIGDSEDATDLAVAEEVVGSSKRASLSGGVTAYGNYSTVEEASRQLQLSYPAVGIKQTDDDIKIVEAEEEAPAPVDIHRVTVGDVEVSTLFEALKQAKLSLQQRRCWERHQIPEILIAYWMSQLCSAVYFLHSQGIVIRDLRPDNLLMDKDANLKLTFCSQWQCVTPCLDDCAIDDLYVAPEVTNIFAETTDAADRWSVGALLLELLCGQKLGEICLHGFESLKDLSIPDSVTMSFAARDLLSRLLVKDAEQRLSDDELRIHPFFEGVVNNDKVAPDRTQM